MKNLLKNYLKVFVLLLGVSVLLWNCEKEDIVIDNQISLVNQFQKNFNSKEFSEVIPYSFEVDWDNNISHYSEELETSYLEFPVVFTSHFNPNNISNPNKKTKTTYKIIATENDNNFYNFYVIKFFQKLNTNNSPISDASINFSDFKNFTGLIQILDKENDLVFAKRLINGVLKDDKVYADKEFKKSSYKKIIVTTCQTRVTYHYTDWYTLHPSGNLTFTGTSYEGASVETVCTDDWFPEIQESGGGGGGTYSSSSSGDNGIYQNCVDCVHSIEDEVDVPPSCKSFNFVKTTGTWQESAVKNIRVHVFLLKPNGVKYKFTLGFSQPVLFGMPANLQNGGSVSSGVAAEISADVLFKTMSEIGQEYSNTQTSETNVNIAFKERLKENYRKYIPGGRVQFNAANFTVIPTDYITEMFGTGDCN